MPFYIMTQMILCLHGLLSSVFSIFPTYTYTGLECLYFILVSTYSTYVVYSILRTYSALRERASEARPRPRVTCIGDLTDFVKMPRLRKQPFQRKVPAKDLKLEDEVFFCEATCEVFRDYDEFYQRIILCNSTVWSCTLTGKANLTYDEAVESENKGPQGGARSPSRSRRASSGWPCTTPRGTAASRTWWTTSTSTPATGTSWARSWRRSSRSSGATAGS